MTFSTTRSLRQNSAIKRWKSPHRRAVDNLLQPVRTGSAFENIVRNALRYSNQHIQVAFSADTKGISIVVDDDGPGVSPEDREHIFRPFYRTDEARDRESGGTGLGLAIVAPLSASTTVKSPPTTARSADFAWKSGCRCTRAEVLW